VITTSDSAANKDGDNASITRMDAFGPFNASSINSIFGAAALADLVKAAIASFAR
jgi:hypothetical protein